MKKKIIIGVIVVLLILLTVFMIWRGVQQAEERKRAANKALFEGNSDGVDVEDIYDAFEDKYSGN